MPAAEAFAICSAASFCVRSSCCPAEQGEAKAKRTLGTAGLRRARVPALSFRLIADGIGARSEDIAQKRLAFGRAALGGAARPVECREEIRSATFIRLR